MTLRIDEHVRGVTAYRVHCDEIWSFCYAKAKNVAHAKAAPDEVGEVWTWSAIDSGSKLIVSWLVGGRDSGYAIEFMDDLRSRLKSRVQLTADGHRSYLEAIEGAFGGDVDYAQLVKLYGEPKEQGPERKYSPPVWLGARKTVEGNPHPDYVSTSHVERHNLTMRKSMWRFTRLTNAFSEKIENHCHALALYFVWYNFCRIHKAHRMSPAIAAGVTDTLRDMEWIAGLVEAAAPKFGPRGPYKRRNKEA